MEPVISVGAGHPVSGEVVGTTQGQQNVTVARNALGIGFVAIWLKGERAVVRTKTCNRQRGIVKEKSFGG